ncbi:MAG: hypothetical protein HY914_18145 [Desulfomonile tiedjei]|nr:hypothetical protein [Desulfomonile tiedjei]
MQTPLKDFPDLPADPNGGHPGEREREGRLSWAVLIVGVLVWCCAQGYLILTPVCTRTMLPETDDTLPYVVRAARMEQCFSADCLALTDLREQLHTPSARQEEAAYRSWAGSVFGSQNPLFSLLLLGIKQFGTDLITAYKVVCAAAVLVFALGFAYLLAVLYGLPGAGIAMVFLGLKVFPDTGLNFVVPSNLAMAVALFVFGRVISCRGRAPWSLVLGTLVMAGIHPIGLLYSIIAATIALSLAGFSMQQKSLLIALAVVLAMLVIGMFLPSRVYELPRYLELVSPGALLSQASASFSVITAEVNNLKDGLCGSIPFLCAGAAWGFMTLSSERRSAVKKTLGVYSVFLVLVLCYPPREPGDTFFRIWIPHVAIFFGAIGYGLWYAIKSIGSSDGRDRAQVQPGQRRLEECWPVLLVALLGGWGLQMVLAGGEQIVMTADYFRKRQPLHICDSQPQLLMSSAKPDDRVLYLSMLVMPYYFVNGAMKAGAVYYHEAIKETDVVKTWLSRPDIRFAVAYNPLVYHPSFEKLHERRWGISAPNFRFSEWNQPRTFGPVLQEDSIPLEDFKWIEVEPTAGPFPRRLKLTLNRVDTPCSLQLIPINELDHPITDLEVTRTITRGVPDRTTDEYERTLGRSGMKFGAPHDGVTIELDLQPFAGRARRLRLVFSGWKPTAQLAGLSFDDSPLHWPWDQKARLTLMSRKSEVGELTFSFDPARILPDPVNRREITVLDDCGGSVLFRIGR